MIDYRILNANLPNYEVTPTFVKLQFTLQIGEVRNGDYVPLYEIPNFQLRELDNALYVANPQKPRLTKGDVPGVYRVAKQAGSERDQYDNTFNFVLDRSGEKPKVAPAPYAEKQRMAALAIEKFQSLVAESGGVGVSEPVAATTLSGIPSCPKCEGRMWDNRVSKKNPKAPDYKCRDRSCDGVIWPDKNARPAAAPAASGTTETEGAELGLPGGLVDDLPF